MQDEDDWGHLAANHAVWEHTDTDTDGVKERTVSLVRQLAELRPSVDLAGDPWQDATFAARITRRLADLLPAGLTLGPDEAELLVVAPFLYDTLWSDLAAAERTVGPADLTPSQDASSDRAAFERFAQTYPQPYRRATAAIRAERFEIGREIGWWLLHRWIGRRPDAYRPASIEHLVDGAANPPRLAELLRTMRADPGFLSRGDRPGALAATAPDGVREQLLGFLLAAARGMAIEATALPEVIGEHLGIADPVSPAAILDTVAAATWRPRGAAVVLGAACAHPSIEVALRVHVDMLNQLLAEAHRAAAADESLHPLLDLPTRVATDDVGPAVIDDSPAYQSAGVRFRLAEDRVQELLMGEQLYGDPALAIRELYQNALDACRYREARTEYLRRAHDLPSDWEGQIRFAQGVDDAGRAYLDCVDNGVGMGVRELSEVFSQAGVRLADLPEFLEEQAEWARLDPPVQLFPNSRFGIGVLSYFMLADEITVETCRMRRDGRPGDRLRVSIAGPGSLFRIQKVPATDPQAGTTVRLHLRDGVTVSSVEKLREVLWVAEFRTDAEDGVNRQSWLPGELADIVQERGDEDDPRSTAPVPAEGSRVWWCHGEGALLADGLYAGKEIFGAVVNLSRDLAPRLSVDRTKILAYREEDVDRLLWEAAPALTAPGTTLLDYDWLYSLAQARPLIADLVFEQAIANGHGKWTLGDDTVDAAIAGCFSANDGTVNGPDELVEWRLTALAAGGRFRKVLPEGGGGSDWDRAMRARPSDALLLSIDVDGAAPWLDPVDLVPLVHLVRAARRIGRSAAEVAARLEALGYNLSIGADHVGTDPDDLVMTSRDVDGARPWLDPAEPVRLVHLLRTVHRTGRPAHEIVVRLRALGFTVDLDIDALPMEEFGPRDIILASRDLDGAGPWLDPGEPVPLVHLLRAAHRVNLSATQTAERLALLGHHFAAGWQSVRVEPDDLVLLARDLDSSAPWLDRDEAVPPIHVLRAAERTARPVREVVERLRSVGYEFAADAPALAALEDVKLQPDDLTMASRDLDGSQPWLDPTRPVPLIHLLRAAEATGRELADVIGRLSTCGYRVDIDPDAVLIDHLEPDDLTLASEDNDGTDPWLDPDKPVPIIRILRSAQRTRRSIHDVAARLAFLGYSVSLDDSEVPLEEIETDDLLITSRDLDGSQPWLDLDEPVPLPHLLQAARRVRKPVREVAARLERLGYSVEADLALVAVDGVKPSDLILASNDLDGSRPWLDAGQPVPLGHLVNAAQKVRKPLDEVADRLRMLGYSVPDLDARLPRMRPGGV